MADAAQPEHVGVPNETACARVWFHNRYMGWAPDAAMCPRPKVAAEA